MGLQEDIINEFISKLLATKKVSNTLAENLRILFSSKDVDEEALRKIVEGE